MGRYLIVANQTLGGPELTARIASFGAEGPASVHFVAPVTDTEGTHQWDYPPIDRAIPDAHTIARTLAEARLQHELARLRGLGIIADGEVADANPVQRVRELCAGEQFDEVIVATLPHRLSRWLRSDLPHRLSRALAVQVTSLESTAGPSI
jgi:hypothetical protein